MATRTATMAATARAAEARDLWALSGPVTELAPLLSGRRAAAAALVVLAVAVLAVGPALAGAGIVIDPHALSAAAAWFERLTISAPAVLAARALAAVVAVVAISRSDGLG